MASVLEIYNEMAYGDVEDNASLAKEWLKNKEFFPFINNIWETRDNQDRVPVILNCMGELPVSIYSATDADVEKAIKSCLGARGPWLDLESTREHHLNNVVKHLQKHATLLAQVESLSRSIQIKDPVEFDVPALIGWFKYYASWAPIKVVEHTPWKAHGIVLVIVDENTPLAALAWLIAPAIAVGNCVCLCVPAKSSLSALLLSEIFAEAGLPKGVFNVLPGRQETFSQLITSPDVAHIRSFGPTSFVKEINLRLADYPKKTLSALMSGRSPMLVFDSSDVHSAIDRAVRSAWQNHGSVPWSVKLLLVQESIFKAFVTKLKARVGRLRVGHSFDTLADVGKPYDVSVIDGIAKMTAHAKTEGLEVFQRELSEKEIADGFFPPTLVIGGEVVSNQVIECQEYPPVISVVPFRTAKEAVALANNSRFGLAASVWTNNLTLAMDVTHQLQFGTVWVNCHGIIDPLVPIHGWKESGLGDFAGKPGYIDCHYLQEQKDFREVKVCNNSSSMACLPSDEKYKAYETYQLYHSGGYKTTDVKRSVVREKNTLITFCDANRNDVNLAVASASQALASWSADATTRSEVLLKIANKLWENKSKLVSYMERSSRVEVPDNGFPFAVEHVYACFKYWGCMANKCTLEQVQKPGFVLNITQEPLGVVALGIYKDAGKETSVCHEAMWQLAGALSLGNPVVVVVDLKNPSGVLELFKTICEAGVPAGVLSVLSGNSFSVMKAVAEHPGVRAVFHWNYPNNLARIVRLAGCESMKPVRQAVEAAGPPMALLGAANMTFGMHASQSKAVWFSKGEIFAN